MDSSDEFDELHDQTDTLRESISNTAAITAAFDAEIKRMASTISSAGNDVKALERGMTGGLRKALDGVVFDGLKASDALRTVANSIVATAFRAASTPVTDHFGGLMAHGVGGLINGVMPFAKGGTFTQGRVTPFAVGGVVSSPTSFPIRGGTGLMGEAGPEAIMPLSRGLDGKLGVKSQGGGGGVTVVMNIQTPDAASFQRCRSQIAAQMSRALQQGQRNR
ncbi:phage tail tape measure protein, lambda family [Poseidonocella pacifica]|uniref:Phage tail tape measure protein, lambda family n=1 Tax=Poseidonocella pacifica TaxID=871651 RepID=A0A1I0VNJ0_9RHOB|nr:phage tail tape measure protein [Poseidonocella pacifica]SFA78059.1 phage tail tape measure protein, lambda family [Poseidonocella pacifica]